MLFSKRLPASSLIEFCRALRHNLSAGLGLPKVMRQQAQRGPLAVRPVATRLAADLENGESLEAALRSERAVFPPLFLSLTSVGERTGNLPEVFGELEKYYTLQLRLWRQFIGMIAWPVFQLVAGIFTIALMIFILGIIAAIYHTKNAIDPIGLGLGTAGAIKFLLVSFGSIGAVIALYMFSSRSLQHKAVIDHLLLRIPVVGSCLRALALMRFCLALRLTQETALPVVTAIRYSLRATGNAAFETRSEPVENALRAGDDLTQALRRCGLFPPQFLDILAVAEEGGRVAEVMEHQAEFYEDEARRRLTILARVAGFLVWLIVAGLLIWAIFRIVILTYIQPINRLTT